MGPTLELVDQNIMEKTTSENGVEDANVEFGNGPVETPLETTDDAHTTNEIINRVGSRQLLFDSEHPLHKNKQFVTLAWMEVADGLHLNGKPMNWKGCRDKWRNLRVYFNRVKRDGKGKSGDGRFGGKQWAYYKKMESVLSRCATENDNTTSNLEDDEEQAVVTNESPHQDSGSTPNENVIVETPAGPSSAPKSLRKRKWKEDEETSQLLEFLKNSGKDEDKYYHWAMALADDLRKMPENKARIAQARISQIVCDIYDD